MKKKATWRKTDKRHIAAIYEEDNAVLFVPTETMWDLHDSSVRLNAASQSNSHGRGRGHPKRLGRERRLGGSVASYRDVFREAGKAPDPMPPRWSPPAGYLLTFMRRHPRHKWLEGWIFRGDDPPANVTVVSRPNVARARNAWDYQAILSELHCDKNTWAKWFKSVLPGYGAEWLLFLYAGIVPAGWYVIDRALMRVRRERTVEGICSIKTLRVKEGTVGKWKNDNHLSTMLTKAIDHASKPGKKLPPEDREWLALNAKTRISMWAYAMFANLPACLRRANASGRYFECLREISADARLRHYNPDEVRRYLAGEQRNLSGRYFSAKSCDGLFIPPIAVLEFQERAMRRWSENAVRDLVSLPCFQHWLGDWASPSGKWKPRRARRFRPFEASQPIGTDKELHSPGIAPQHSPADDGWHFVPGGFWYRRELHTISGKKLALLRTIVESKAPVSFEQLAASVWPGDEPSHDTVRATLLNTRKFLRADFTLPRDFDPLPFAGDKRVQAWTLANNLR